MTRRPSSPVAPVSRRSFLKAGAGLAAGTVLGSTGVQAVTARMASVGTRCRHERLDVSAAGGGRVQRRSS